MYSSRLLASVIAAAAASRSAAIADKRVTSVVNPDRHVRPIDCPK